MDEPGGLERILANCREALAESAPDAPPSPPTDFDPAHLASMGATLLEPGPIEEGAVATGATDFGRYQVTRRIAKGGMGEIIKAYDPGIQREVAIKVLPTRRQVPEPVVRKFLQEARITGQLEHPNIVPVYELALSDGGRSYFSMKLVRGQSLSEILRGLLEEETRRLGHRINRRFLTVPPDLRDAYPLVRRLGDFLKVLDAVAFAHSRGVIHRDLKPANLMIGEYGEVLVMDWGLAKVAGADGPGTAHLPPVDAGSDGDQTVDGTVIGTPSYMPPEQAEGSIEEIDVRSDVYSLGATLYELLTLRPPYVAASKSEILAQVVAGRLVPPRRRAPPWRIPRELEAVVLRAMARDPRDRYRDVPSFKADIEAFLQGRTLRAATYTPLQVAAKWAWRHRAATAVLGALVLAAGLSLGIDAERDRAARRDRVDAALAEANRRIESVADSEALRRERLRPVREGELLVGDGSGDWEYWETTEQRQAREASLKAYLDAVSALEKALAVDPSSGRARALRLSTGLELGRIALLGRNFVLARRAFEDLADYGAPVAEVEGLVASVEAARDEVHRWRGVRLGAILADLRLGLSRQGRDPAAPLLEDYVREALRYRDPRTVDVLSRALEPLVQKGFREGRAARWEREEIDVAAFVCRVLGSIDLAESVAPLSRWMAAVWHPELAVEAGTALCNTRHPDALAPLLAARERLRTEPALQAAWDRIQLRFNRLPNATATDPAESAESFVRRGLARLDDGDPRGAIADFDRALELDPGLWRAYAHRGLARDRTGDPAGALEDLDRAVQLAPREALPLARRAECHAAAGRVEAALSDLAAALERAPAEPSLHARTGALLAEAGRLDEAFLHLNRALELGSKDPAVTFHRGRILQHRGDLPGAVRDYSLSIQLDPRRPRAYAARASALLEKGNLSGALRDLTFALVLDPADADLHAARADVRLVAQDLEGAAIDWRRALELDPTRWRTWSLLARVLHELGRREEAVPALEEAIRHAPDAERPPLEATLAAWK